jgi:hypothetical protein
VTFDHSTTRFPLEGRHVEPACASCHPLQRYAETSTECGACHRLDDVHRGRLGSNCATCHTAAGWQKTGFDHGRETQFPLRGRHHGLTCRTCHVADPKESEVAAACIGCHSADDDHLGRFGERCAECHDESGWKRARFDHERATDHALNGAHERLPCASCHLMSMPASSVPAACNDCHAEVDVHEGTLGSSCGTCHTETSFRERGGFDHQLTGFPLLALHQLASCEDCHVSTRFREAKSECAVCHAKDDVHETHLGDDCARCHNPSGWNRWVFDHDVETDFRLGGKHRDLQCSSCHGAARISDRCDTCHLADSPHDDAYGRNCERCHVDTSWSEIERGRR